MLTARLAQVDPALGDVEANVEAVLAAVGRAETDDVDLLVFPELSLTGYHLSAGEFAERRDAVERGLDRLEAAATEVTVVVGTPTYDPLRNSAVVVGDGARLGSYHKVHLYGSEDEVFTAGDRIDPIDTPVGTLGVEICYDLEFPEVCRALALGGADVLVTVSANMRPFVDYQAAYLRARGMENAVPHLLCNRVGEEDGTDFFGGSGAVGASGTVLGQAAVDEVVEIDLTVDPAARPDDSLSYHADRRPDCYGRLTGRD
jgi:predicted amidohydrolase